jgi:mannitol-1-/sugar-/sorbitol-6-phosphatase
MKERSLSCRALLFDMDGVLVDSTPHVDRVWRKWAREKGLDEDEVMAIAHGRRSLEVIQAVAPHLATPEEVIAVEQMEGHGSAPIERLPGAERLLTSLPAGVWAVVTSASEELARSRLSLVGLPNPSVLVSADDIDAGKPDPAPYLKAAEAIRQPPEACVVFEDTPAGIEAGRTAGMTVVGLATTYEPEIISNADLIAESLAAVDARVNASKIDVLVRTVYETS